jgi:hydrogenase maturation protein HypF
MELEFASWGFESGQSYPFEIISGYGESIIDWEQIIRHIIHDLERHVAAGSISSKFHNTLAEIIVECAKREGQEQVVLSGGCFQNKYLTERAISRLAMEGFRPYFHQRIPPNDGGIALGQIIAVPFKKE